MELQYTFWLPKEIYKIIFSFTIESFSNIRLVCKYWKSLIHELNDPSKNNNWEIRNACYKNRIEYTKFLLQDSRVDISTLSDELLQGCCCNGYYDIIKLLLKNERLIIKDDEHLVTACKYGHYDIVELLLHDERVNALTCIDKILQWSYVKGHHTIIHLLIQNVKTKHLVINNKTFQWACNRGYYKIVKLLLKDLIIDPCFNYCYSLVSSSHNGHLKIVKLLLKDSRIIQFLSEYNKDYKCENAIKKIIEYPSKYGHWKVLKLLLKIEAFSSIDFEDALKYAAKNNHYKILKMLLNYSFNNIYANIHYIMISGDEKMRKWIVKNFKSNGYKDTFVYFDKFNKSLNNKYKYIIDWLIGDIKTNTLEHNKNLFWIGINYGYIDLVRMFLECDSLNPFSFYENREVGMAIYARNLEIAMLLLKDSRANPSASNNDAIVYASAYGYYEIVKLLLQDSRVDPSAQSNKAVIFASGNGHIDIVRLLLKDSRVDPSDNNNDAIRQSVENSKYETVKLLLEDDRVDPSTKNNYCLIEGNSKITKLLLNNSKIKFNNDTSDILSQYISNYNHLDFEKLELLLNDNRIQIPINFEDQLQRKYNYYYQYINNYQESTRDWAKKHCEILIKVKEIVKQKQRL